MSSPRVVAIVPMRHESKRVPGKNYRPFAGEPLYRHIVRTLLRCGRIAQIVIDTDSDTILTDARLHFPQVALVRRPEHLRADTIPMNDVLLNTVRRFDADFYLQTHSTNPLLEADTIAVGLARLLDQFPCYDSLFSVTRMQSRLWDQLTRPINHNPAILLRTQDLPPIYEENSCLYVFRRQELESRHNRIGQRPLMFEIERLQACDIDEEADFQLAEQLFLRRHRSAQAA